MQPPSNGEPEKFYRAVAQLLAERQQLGQHVIFRDTRLDGEINDQTSESD